MCQKFENDVLEEIDQGDAKRPDPYVLPFGIPNASEAILGALTIHFPQTKNHFGHGLNHFPHGLNHFSQGPNHSSHGPNHSSHGLRHFARGPNHSSLGLDHSSHGPNHLPHGLNHSSHGLDHSSHGPNHFSHGLNHFGNAKNDLAKAKLRMCGESSGFARRGTCPTKFRSRRTFHFFLSAFPVRAKMVATKMKNFAHLLVVALLMLGPVVFVKAQAHSDEKTLDIRTGSRRQFRPWRARNSRAGSARLRKWPRPV